MDRCEVCASSRPEDWTIRPLVELELDVRKVLLCRGHARIAAKSGVRTFEELRDYYGRGRRSFVGRRDPQAAPGDRPRSPGRRSTDVAVG